jgi:hypothetical protein
MGLDMYAYKTRKVPDQPVDFERPEDAERFFYWRKHPDLHGWMERLYWLRGGQGRRSGFNCVPLALTLEDLDHLEAAVENGALPHTEGFFFGASGPDRTQEDREFIRLAREATAEGMCVYYFSWW